MWKTYRSVKTTAKTLKSLGGKLKDELEHLMKEFEEDMKDFDFPDLEEVFEMPTNTESTYQINSLNPELFCEKVNVIIKSGWIVESLTYDAKNGYEALFRGKIKKAEAKKS